MRGVGFSRGVAISLLSIFGLLAVRVSGISSFLQADAKSLLSIHSSLTDVKDSLITWNNANISSVCHWYGVTCRRRSTGWRVIAVNIGNLSLSGNLSASSVSLPSLEVLNISGNAFSSSGIPSFIFKLPRLKKLYLSGNRFRGLLNDSSFDSLASSIYFLDLSRNSFYGNLPSAVSALPSLMFLNLSSNGFNGSIPTSLSNISGLTDLSLADNHFSGEIPASLARLSSLRSLNLSTNELSGSIPAELGNLTTLESFDVSGNLLSGEISSGFSKYNSSSFEGNPNLCGPPLPTLCSVVTVSNDTNNGTYNTPPTERAASSTNNFLLAGIIVLSTLLFVVLAGLGIVMYMRYRKSSTIRPDTEGKKDEQASFSLSGHGKLVLYMRLDFIFGIEDIIDATDNFDPKFLIGSGSFGSVYSACLAGDNVNLAVKRLTPDSNLDERKFKTQIDLLGQVKHEHLVPTVGCFSDPLSGERLLLYPKLRGGNLWTAILNKVDWNTRLGIALQTSTAIRSLHESEPMIIHGNIKPENILLDETSNVKVADYGLVPVLKMKASSATNRPQGSAGYLAPEFVARRKLSEKTDIYAFGVVLLQLVTGRSPHDPVVKRSTLPQWAMSNSYTVVIDPSLDWLGDYKEIVLGVLRLGILCAAKNPDGRPTMADIEATLKKLAEISFRIMNEIEEEVAINM